MKKFFILLALFPIILNMKSDNYVIPSEAIRLRVIANSNSVYDQNVKMQVKDQVEQDLGKILKDTKGIDEARDILKDNLKEVDKNIDELLQKIDYNLGYQISFGNNYFPEKKYRGVIYEEGYYESLVITLGEGKGDNWWCVLFPPLCLLEATESDEVEYKFFVQELFEKYL